MRLAMVPGVGPRLRQLLLERFGSPQKVLSAAPSELRTVAGIGSKLTARIALARSEIDVHAQIALAREHAISIWCEADDFYPRMLREIHDPPPILFVRGSITTEDRLAIGIVGSRHATHYGRTLTARIAGGLARAGLTVVSGLARGIDAAAHRGALDAGGRTLAVLGGGILNLYPPEHRQLADEITRSGALVSEAPLRARPIGGAFPQRNRIISGLSLGVIVIEAATRSGALITARHALEQGRDVFALPGRVDSRVSGGCHRLLRDGAYLIESAEDVLDALGPLVESTPREDGTTVHHPAELKLNELEQQVLQSITPDAMPIDQIVAKTGLPVSRILATLSVLEVRHLIRRVSGQQVARI